jgi:NitT/TauT family transport system substrate-binding protein
VVLPEPLATSVMMQTMDSDRPLHRVVRFDVELASLGEAVARSAIAGTVALPGIQEHPELIEIFTAEYEAAVTWMLENPDEAGLMAEENLPELGFKAGPTAMSLKNIDWEYVRASDGQAAISAFLEELMTLSPAVVGGQLPDAGFYYGYTESK